MKRFLLVALFFMASSAYALELDTDSNGYIDQQFGGTNAGAINSVTVQASDPVVTDTEGVYIATTSQKYFIINSDGMWESPVGIWTAATVIPDYTLTIDTTGWGTGDGVTGTGIACPGDCTEDYAEDTVVSLTATAGTDRQFDNWLTGLTGSTNPDSVTMTAATTVGAAFSAVSTGTNIITNPDDITAVGWVPRNGVVTIDAESWTDSDINGLGSMRTPNITIVSGKTYTLNFEYKTSGGLDFFAFLVDNSTGWVETGNLAATTSWTSYTTTWVATSGAIDTKLNLEIGRDVMSTETGYVRYLELLEAD